MSADEPSIRTRYASRILREAVTEEHLKLPQDDNRRFPAEPAHGVELPPWHIPKLELPRQDPPFDAPVGIVGAGVAGLYLARELDRWDISYEILESSGRVGGRVYTHYFQNPHVAHNYYDVGAMRFPDLQIMYPVLKLFFELKLDIKPYYLSYEKAPNLFTNQSISSKEIDSILMPLAEAVKPYIDELTKNFETGFKKLMKEDAYSTREFLRVRKGMSFNQVTQLETFDTSTGLFDQAFTETVLDFFDFNVANDWFRVDGGTSKFTDAMHLQLKRKAELNKRVTAIGQLQDGSRRITVTIAGECRPRKYLAVFNTTTMGCLGQMDLSQLPLRRQQQTAIRALSYDRACKVGIKFSRPWWNDYDVDLGAGGSSATDLPIRTTVYPSWNDGTDEPAVLICSYTWAQDATRMGALISDKATEDALYELVLRNLVRLFKGRPSCRGVPSVTYELLQGLVLEHHAYSYAQDPNTLGAFALFGPGQFTNLYPAVKQPAANGHFYMVGECVSEHHAWIVGAIQSVKEALKMFFIRFNQVNPLIWLHENPYGPAEPAKSELNVLYWLVQHATAEPLKIREPIQNEERL